MIHQGEHLVGGSLSEVDDEIGMLLRYCRRSDAVALQTELIEETSGALSRRILKDRAGVREGKGLAPPAIAIEPSHLLPDLRRIPLHGPQRGLYDDALRRQAGEAIAHLHIMPADLEHAA